MLYKMNLAIRIFFDLDIAIITVALEPDSSLTQRMLEYRPRCLITQVSRINNLIYFRHYGLHGKLSFDITANCGKYILVSG